jgi:hypothetical protein
MTASRIHKFRIKCLSLFMTTGGLFFFPFAGCDQLMAFLGIGGEKVETPPPPPIESPVGPFDPCDAGFFPFCN